MQPLEPRNHKGSGTGEPDAAKAGLPPLDRALTVHEIVRRGWPASRYRWLTLLFVALYLPYAALSVPLPAAYGLLAVGVVNYAIRTLSAIRLGGANDRRRAWIFNLLDVAVISAGVRVSGGLESELWLLYFILLASEAAYSAPADSRTLTVVLLAAYSAAAWHSPWQQGEAAVLAIRLFMLYVVGRYARRIAMAHERRNQEIASLCEQVAAIEERTRIARDLHDSLGHALVAAILRLELCRRLVHREPEEAERVLDEEAQALRTAWDEARDLAFHLRPWERDPAGFVDGLRRHIARFAERTGVVVELAASTDSIPLAPDQELALMRILQEALTNIAKHSRCTKARVDLALQGSRLTVRVEDDGVGFDPEAVTSGQGLEAMHQRVRELDGTLQVASRPGGGTSLLISLRCG
jgi:signal transduction histidine kinase